MAAAELSSCLAGEVGATGQAATLSDAGRTALPTRIGPVGATTPGAYALLMELDPDAIIPVGRLGTFEFPAGWYVYVGSALGGLDRRLRRHLRPSAIRHWHVDYLRAEAPIREIHVFPGRVRRECELARAIVALPGASIPVAGFGASDCRCRSHLAHFSGRPVLDGETMRVLLSVTAS